MFRKQKVGSGLMLIWNIVGNIKFWRADLEQYEFSERECGSIVNNFFVDRAR